MEFDKCNELVKIEKMDIVSFFTKEDDMEKILSKIREASLVGYTQNVETVANRKAIASMAYRVAQSKTILEKAGKDLVSEWKAKTKKIDESRKRSRDYLDALRDEIRQPLTKWEIAEEEREKREKEAAELAEAWDAAHIEHELFLRQEAIEKKEAEIARIHAEKEAAEAQKKHDELIRQKAAEEAEEKIIKMRNTEAAERRNLIIQAEKEKAEKERQFKAEKEKAIADLKLEIEEKEKKKLLEAEKEKAIAEKKAADITHQKKINNTILKGMMAEGLTESQAKKIITAIFCNKIKHITINY